MNTLHSNNLLERLNRLHPLGTRVVLGLDAVNEVGGITRELAPRSVLLVTDPGLVAAGHAGRVHGLLADSGLRVEVFERVQENPTTDCVAACLQAARGAHIEAFVALGGGSAIDTAKGCNFLLTNGGEMKDYRGVGKARKPMLPLVAIPTTAGTGSEMQSAALVADATTHQKMACLDPKAMARVAILDPRLTLSQPARVAASTGIDALAHAIESAVARNRTETSGIYAREAFGLAVPALPVILQEPDNLDARADMLLAAALAGVAIENSMLGAAHSAANPLTAHYNVVHGQAVGLMLPHVIRFNAGDPAARQVYAELCAILPEEAREGAHCDAPGELLAHFVEALLDLGGMPRDLVQTGGNIADINMLAAEAAQQWTARFNPRATDPADFASLYQSAFGLRQRQEM